jgi:hypothetical protein
VGREEQIQVDGRVSLGAEPLEVLDEPIRGHGEPVGMEVALDVIPDVVVREDLDGGDATGGSRGGGRGARAFARAPVSGSAPGQHHEKAHDDERGNEGRRQGPMHQNTLQEKPR